MYGRSAAAYREVQVLGSTKEQLVPLLYEHLLKSLRRAGKQIETQDLEGKSASMTRAADILYELMGALDMERGGEISSRLATLYAYFLRELGEISRGLDTQRLDRLVDTIATLHEAWVQAAAATTAADQVPLTSRVAQ